MADYYSSTSLLAASTLRNVLGTKNLSELLTERESIAGVIKNTLDLATDPWGIEVERVEMYKPFYFINLTNLKFQMFFIEYSAKTLACRFSCNEQWPPKLKPVVKVYHCI